MLQLFPRVIPAGKKTALVISGDDLKGKRKIYVAAQSTEIYNVPHCEKYFIDEDKRYKFSAVAVKGGKAEFEFTPVGEQKHRIYVDTGSRRITFEVFSLEKDLYELNPYKGDTHMHSTESDGLFTPAEVVAAYYERGYDYIAITDHHKYRGSEKIAKTVDKIAKRFKVYPGEEVHNRGMGYFHIINFGGSDSVNEIILADTDGVFASVTADAERLKKEYSLPDYVDAKEFAFRKWVSDKIREFGGVSVLCHPYWDAYGEYNMQTPMLETLLKNGVYDAFEVVDDDDKTGNGVNLQVAMYNELRADGVKIPIVGASDCHNVVSEIFDKFFTYAFAKDVGDVKNAVKDFKSVAVERIGNEYRVHGPFRLVRYARFLTDNFESGMAEIRKGVAGKVEEIIKKRDGSAMAKIEEPAENFRKAFFGR